MIRRFTPVTTALLVIITIVFGIEFATGAFTNETRLAAMGAIVPGLLQRGEYWRLVAAMFLHGGGVHWLVNCWSLYQLGTLYEALFGSPRFTLIYFVSGICASIASAAHIEQGVGVGASGAIFGILGAFVFSLIRSPLYRHQPWTKSLINQLIFWIVINIGIGLYFPFIDNYAHIGGLIAGLLLGFLPHRVPPPPPGTMVIEVPPQQHYGSE